MLEICVDKKIQLEEVVFDMEVLPNWWCMVYSDPEFKNVKVITSQTPNYIQLIRQLSIKRVLIGFNVKGYDMRILNAIQSGCDTHRVYKVSKAIIYDEPDFFNNYNFWNKFIFSDLYDDWLFGSLKEFESNIGLSIKESDISFDKEILTEKDKEELIKYCKHDVFATCKLLEYRRSYIESKKILADFYKIRLDIALKSTNAKLASIILGAERTYYEPNDRFIIPKKVEKYIRENLPNDIISMFDIISKENKEAYLFGNNIIFGVGGIHSIIDNEIFARSNDSYVIKKIDVTSYYPNLMMLFNYISRSVKNPQKLKEIYDLRKDLKRQAGEELKTNGKTEKWKYLNDFQTALKLIINISYGAMKNKYNDLYDEYNASSLCYLGQLLLAALSNKLYKLGNVKIIQTNTDGIIVKILREDEKKIEKIVSEWEEITGFEMECDIINFLFQRDVNNYIEGTNNFNNPYEIKGKWSNQAIDRKLSNLNAPITHLAILKYYTENIPIEETILNCNDLFEFCFTTKTGYTYDKTYHLCNDNKILINKVNRVVATTKKEFGTIYKYKNIEGKIRFDKIAEIPENCFIVNDSLEMIDHLDKQWYINFAKNKIKELKEI